MNEEKKDVAQVPLFAHEVALMRLDRINRRLALFGAAGWIVAAVAIVLCLWK